MNKKKLRAWCYVQQPTAYEISCDKCGGSNITWSEFEHMIWCFDCKIDTCGTGGIFDGPIPLEVSKMFGISFDRIDLKTRKIKRMMITKTGKLIWRSKEDVEKKWSHKMKNLWIP